MSYRLGGFRACSNLARDRGRRFGGTDRLWLGRAVLFWDRHRPTSHSVQGEKASLSLSLSLDGTKKLFEQQKSWLGGPPLMATSDRHESALAERV